MKLNNDPVHVRRRRVATGVPYDEPARSIVVSDDSRTS